MQVAKIFRAYYDDGFFVPYEPVSIPKGCQVVVTVLDFLAEVHAGVKRAKFSDDFNAPLEDLKEYMH